jgi:hypothetical protein
MRHYRVKSSGMLCSVVGYGNGRASKKRLKRQQNRDDNLVSRKHVTICRSVSDESIPPIVILSLPLSVLQYME